MNVPMATASAGSGLSHRPLNPQKTIYHGTPPSALHRVHDEFVISLFAISLGQLLHVAHLQHRAGKAHSPDPLVHVIVSEPRIPSAVSSEISHPLGKTAHIASSPAIGAGRRYALQRRCQETAHPGRDVCVSGTLRVLRPYSYCPATHTIAATALSNPTLRRREQATTPYHSPRRLHHLVLHSYSAHLVALCNGAGAKARRNARWRGVGAGG